MGNIGDRVARRFLALAGLALFAGAPARAAWQGDSLLPFAYYNNKAVAGNGFLYKIGGQGDLGTCGMRDVYYAPLNPDGSAGAWTKTAPLPALSTTTVNATCANTPFVMPSIIIGWGYDAVYWNGFVYVLGGNQWNFNGFPDGQRIHFSNGVYVARVNPDGSLGDWQTTTAMSTAAFSGAAAVGNGYLYMTGGRTDAATSVVNRSVQFAPLNADGTVGAWRTSADLMPGGLTAHAAEVLNGRLYISGGVTAPPFPTGQITNGVWSAPLAADGTPGAFRQEGLLPVGLAGHGMKARHGLLYTVGGQEPTAPAVSVHVASAAPDGSLASWGSADALPQPLYIGGAAAAGSTLYAVGGNNGAGGVKTSYRLADAVPPAAVTDLAAAPLDATSLRLSWTAPGDDGAYGSVVNGRYQVTYAPADGAPASSSWTATFDPGTPQSWRLAGLAPGTAYTVTLKAVDPAGNAAPASNQASAQTYFLYASAENPPVATLQTPAAGLSVAALPDAQAAPLLASEPGAPLAALYQFSPSGAALAPGLLAVSVPASRLSDGVALYAYQPGVGWSSAAVSAQAVDPSGSLTGLLAQTGVIGAFGPFPVPSVTDVSPASAVAGASAFVLTVDGAGFGPGSTVQWNGASRPTTFVSGTRLTAAIGAADAASAGTADVTVFTPAPGGGTSSPAAFTILNPVPAAASLAPASAVAGGTDLALAVDGSSFVSGSVVQWNGASRDTSFVSATRVVASIPASDLAAAGAASVAVVNPAPGGGPSGPLSFAILNPAPAVASVSPNTATAGGAGPTLTLSGSGFVAASVARWNGGDRATTYLSSAQLTVALSSADVASAGQGSLTVFTPAPGGGTSAALSFTVVNPPPLAASATPETVVAGSGAFTLTVDGGGFVPGSTVRWNGSPRTTAFVSSGRLTAAISAADAAAAGADAVTVNSPAPGGGTSSPVTVTVANPAPSVASLSPAGATAGGAAFTLTVDGSGFVPGSAVRWNGAPRTTTFVSATRLTAAIPAADVAAAGTDTATVASPAPGGGTSAGAAFTVSNPAPVISSLSPSTATAGGAGFSLTVLGSGFVAGSVARWNGHDRATTFVSAGRIAVAISSSDVAAAGSQSVAVFTPAPGGGTSAAATLTVSAAPSGDPRFRCDFWPPIFDPHGPDRWAHLILQAVSWARRGDLVRENVRLADIDGRPVSMSPAAQRDGDWDSDGDDDDDLQFDRSALAALLKPGHHVFHCEGDLRDGRHWRSESSFDEPDPRDHGQGQRGRGVASLGAAGASAPPSVGFWPEPDNLKKLDTMAWDATPPGASTASDVSAGRVAVRVPDGAAPPALPLTISTAAAQIDAPARDQKAADLGLAAAAPAVQFGPEGTRFVIPVTLEMPYDRSKLPAGTDESSLAIHYWNPARGDWEKLSSTVDRQAQVVRAQTYHFSLYQILGQPGAPSALPLAGADPEFSLKAAYAFPNPVRGASAVTIRIQPGQADSVSVRVYDLSGRKVHESSAFTMDPIKNDGNGLGPQITYDHVWDVSGVGSGVYTYVVRARKSGHADVHKTGKIGVVK